MADGQNSEVIMAESRAHSTVANRLARRFGATYNRGAGADIQTQSVAIEVETEQTVDDAGRQLRGHRKQVFVAGTSRTATDAALERYRDTSISVMDANGRVLKPSSRR